MKKVLISLFIISLLVLNVGCNKSKSETTGSTDSFSSISDDLPDNTSSLTSEEKEQIASNWNSGSGLTITTGGNQNNGNQNNDTENNNRQDNSNPSSNNEHSDALNSSDSESSADETSSVNPESDESNWTPWKPLT